MKMKAVSLVSGGLDSILATEIVRKLGVDVVPVNFVMPFGCTKDKSKSDALKIDITNEFMGVLKSPAHGYGSNVNPCIDCKILMLKKAKAMMEELGVSFLVTGEVVGQRPMSQGKGMLRHIEKEAGVLGLILRPLSAKLLPETLPEKNGWIDRNKLFSISGRGRNQQFDLAAKYGIKDIPQPAGGCLLTDPAYSKRVKDLIDHNELTLDSINLLRLGRYFRLRDNAVLIVGRNQRDNDELLKIRKDSDVFIESQEDVPGPSALGKGKGFSDSEVMQLACKIVARYFAAKGRGKKVEIVVSYNGRKETAEAEPFSDEETRNYIV